MRTSLVLSMILLAATIAVGCYSAGEMESLSQRYVSAAEELRTLARMGDWARAADAAHTYLADWQHTVPLLQILINHEDIDDITLDLERLQAAIEAREAAQCLEICAELRENARHIYHRDAFTLGNVL